MKKISQRMRVISSVLFVVAMLLTSNLIVEPSTAQNQGITAFTATQTDAFVNTPTTITFRATIPSNPNLITTSPNLQRLVGNTWTNLGTMYDDGTHGDASAGDNIYSAQAAVNESQLGTISFRASVAYRGQLQRSFSNTINVNIVPPLGLAIESGSDFITIAQGAQQNVATIITLSKQSSGTVNVKNSVSGTPANGGISITSDYPSSGYTTSVTGSISFVMNQSFLGNTPGTYVVTNTATITGSSPAVTVSDTITIEVLPPGGNPIILPVGSNPDGVMFGTPTQVTFTASVANFQSAPSALSLRRVNGSTDPVVGTLLDDGAGPDLQAADGVYSGTITVNEPTEGNVLFKASGLFPGTSGERSSDNFSLVITCFQTTVAPWDESKIVTDSNTSESLLSNEVLVEFVAGTTCARRAQIATAINGVIAGTQPGLGIHQIVFPGNGAPQGVYNAIATLNSFPEVISATPNFISTLSAVTPNDTDYGKQYAPQKIRADEAWVIARGGPIIAVVDTGVDYTHPDLTGRVISWKDFANNDNDSMDDNNHGTHVAGIAAANSNNGQGIAGIAWNSKILAIKAFKADGNTTTAASASGIKAAADAGAKIINCSFAGVHADVKKKAVDYAVAKGALVVAAAGNNGDNTPLYPGAYDNVFCVGSTTSTDGRADFSNYGAHLDIAAPGKQIYSTVPDGYDFMSGTSMSAPVISGSAAVVWSYFPWWTAGQVRTRLEKTAAPLQLGTQLGHGRVDLFEAVFNGSFEDDINGWSVKGTAGAVPNLGLILAPNREKMGFISSGPSDTQIQTILEQGFTIQPGVTNFAISFSYDFVTEEWPEYKGSIYNDNMQITLIKPDGTAAQLAFESVNGSAFFAVGGIDFPGGDQTVGHTGFKFVSMNIPVTAGPGFYRIVVRDEGDGVYDSNVLIDNIRFK
jgi:hypothetical protein